ncbi:MAG: hypothetical protein NXI25_04420 [bacterium]|nr:hypothetical protein [bacterium]
MQIKVFSVPVVGGEVIQEGLIKIDFLRKVDIFRGVEVVRSPPSSPRRRGRRVALDAGDG